MALKETISMKSEWNTRICLLENTRSEVAMVGIFSPYDAAYNIIPVSSFSC